MTRDGDTDFALQLALQKGKCAAYARQACKARTEAEAREARRFGGREVPYTDTAMEETIRGIRHPLIPRKRPDDRTGDGIGLDSLYPFRSYPPMANKVQLTTDGHKAYLSAVREVDFDADYAMLVKIYGQDGSASGGRYSRPI